MTVSSTTAAKPTLSLPQMELPVAPGPNPTYTAVAATPLRFRLTVMGNGMTDTAETVVRPQGRDADLWPPRAVRSLATPP